MLENLFPLKRTPSRIRAIDKWLFHARDFFIWVRTKILSPDRVISRWMSSECYRDLDSTRVLWNFQWQNVVSGEYQFFTSVNSKFEQTLPWSTRREEERKRHCHQSSHLFFFAFFKEKLTMHNCEVHWFDFSYSSSSSAGKCYSFRSSREDFLGATLAETDGNCFSLIRFVCIDERKRDHSDLFPSSFALFLETIFWLFACLTVIPLS